MGPISQGNTFRNLSLGLGLVALTIVTLVGAGLLGERVSYTPREPTALEPANAPRSRDSLTGLATVPAPASEQEAGRGLLPEPPKGTRLNVLVLLADGRPAPDVRIELVASASSPHRARSEPVAEARSDANGRAELELDALPEPWRSSLFEAHAESTTSFLLRADVLAIPPPTLALPAPPISEVTEALELRLPPTGTLLVEIADEFGEATRIPVELDLLARASGGGPQHAPLRRRLSLEDGRTRIEHVGLGLELSAFVSPRDVARADGSASSAGPLAEGETTTLRVALGPAWPTLAFRALDPDGRPLSEVTIDALLTWTPSPDAAGRARPRSLELPVTTDAEGHALVPVRGHLALGERRTLELQTHAPADADSASSASGSAKPPVLWAELDLSWSLSRGGVHQFGDVVLNARDDATVTAGPDGASGEVPWVTGRVRDLSGKPLASATVLVTSAGEQGARPSSRHAATDREGRFALSGPPVPGPLSVRAMAPGFLADARPAVPLGTTDLELELRAAQRWTGRVRLDPAIAPQSLAVLVRQGERDERQRLSSEVVLIDGLQLGPIDVEVRTWEGDWPVERIQSLPTYPAQEEGTAHELDLRGRLSVLELEFRDPEGRPLDRVHARVTPLPHASAGAWIQNGRLGLVVPSDTALVRVEPVGYLSLEAPLLDRVQVLTCTRR